MKRNAEGRLMIIVSAGPKYIDLQKYVVYHRRSAIDMRQVRVAMAV
jgi:hypothetical protein